MRQIPKAFTPMKVKGFLLNERVALVFSATFFAPVVIGLMSRFRGRIPLIGGHTPLFLFVVSLVILAIAGSFSGYTGAIIYGVAAGALIAAFSSTSIGQQLIGRIQSVGA